MNLLGRSFFESETMRMVKASDSTTVGHVNWIYETDDAPEQVQSLGYFDKSKEFLHQNDIVLVKTYRDGEVKLWLGQVHEADGNRLILHECGWMSA